MLTSTCHAVLICVGVIALSAQACFGASTGFKWESTVLYQPDEPLRARIPSVEDLAAYMKRLEKSCTEFFAGAATPERLDIVVGLKPRRRVRVWFISSTRSSQDRSLVALRKRLEAVQPCDIRQGPVAFALRCTLAGGGPAPKESGYDQLPRPKEWQDAAKRLKGPVVVPDGFFPLVWPD